MSAASDSVPETSPPRASLRGLAIPELVVFLTFSGVALASSTSWMEGSGFAAPSPTGILGLTGIIALLTLVTGVALSLRRTHLSRQRARKALVPIGALQVKATPAIVAQDAEAQPGTEVQALRLKVGTLRAELAEQRAQARVQEQATAKARAQDRGDVERERMETRAAESRRMLLLLRGMREATAGEPGAEHVLNRIEAALTRLNAPPGGRATLSTSTSTATSTSASASTSTSQSTVSEWTVLQALTPPAMTVPASTPLAPESFVSAPLALDPDVAVPPAPVLPVPVPVSPVPEPLVNGSKVLPVPPLGREQPAVRDDGRWFRRKGGRHAQASGGRRAQR